MGMPNKCMCTYNTTDDEVQLGTPHLRQNKSYFLVGITDYKLHNFVGTPDIVVRQWEATYHKMPQEMYARWAIQVQEIGPKFCCHRDIFNPRKGRENLPWRGINPGAYHQNKKLEPDSYDEANDPMDDEIIRPKQRLSAKDKLCLELVEEMAQGKQYQELRQTASLVWFIDTARKAKKSKCPKVKLPAGDDSQDGKLKEDMTELLEKEQ
uniref:Uncharacterized protein n=1 Tax=Romanomermis culicivorax TaxID=13658 RepID=A0A915KTK4_ROMCU